MKSPFMTPSCSRGQEQPVLEHGNALSSRSQAVAIVGVVAFVVRDRRALEHCKPRRAPAPPRIAATLDRLAGARAGLASGIAALAVP